MRWHDTGVMMDCREASISLQLAEDGEISVAEQEALDEHLLECLDCRRMGAWLEEIAAFYPDDEPLDDAFGHEVVMRLATDKSAVDLVEPEDAGLVRPKTVREKRFPKLSKVWSFLTVKKSRRPSRLWSFLLGKQRKPIEPEPPSGWSSNAAGSLAFGVKSLAPALAPAVVGQSYATGWLRIAGSNLRGKSKV